MLWGSLLSKIKDFEHKYFDINVVSLLPVMVVMSLMGGVCSMNILDKILTHTALGRTRLCKDSSC